MLPVLLPCLRTETVPNTKPNNIFKFPPPSPPLNPYHYGWTVQNSQHTWAGKDAEPIDSMEERLFFLKEKLSALQSENESMRASGNDLLKEKIALKEHNTVLADMITNLNGYITNVICGLIWVLTAVHIIHIQVGNDTSSCDVTGFLIQLILLKFWLSLSSQRATY